MQGLHLEEAAEVALRAGLAVQEGQAAEEQAIKEHKLAEEWRIFSLRLWEGTPEAVRQAMLAARLRLREAVAARRLHRAMLHRQLLLEEAALQLLHPKGVVQAMSPMRLHNLPC
mmetsp:Transcript_4423/g.9600  ORF Transcript_4423/g.9600 Transcript_4423/m.9600 type:complete len:114 (+) Transcript_4423:377-718(+)